MMQRREILSPVMGMVGILMSTRSSLSSALSGAGSHGFYVPDEALPHERTFMQWPVSKRVHPDPEFLRELQETISLIANTIAEFEPVVMLMERKHALPARRFLSRDVEIWDIATEDLWARDSGPLFVVNDRNALAVSHMNFNGWGAKQVHRNDGVIASKVAERMGLKLFDNGIVGEPGGVETDGHGMLIAHESSWINPNRNHQSKNAVTTKLLDAMGAERIIWAPGVKGEDITDFHIDALARFVGPGRILIQLPDDIDAQDSFAIAAMETAQILSEEVDLSGKPFEIVRIADPQFTRVQSQDFVAAYVNYYLCNGAVIAAEFGDDDADDKARATLASIYPDREIIQLNVDALGEIGGGIHCATQQQPLVA